MFSTVSNVPLANACKTSSDLVINSRNLLTKPDNLVQSCRGNAVVDSRKTKGQAMADFRVESTGYEAVLASAENSKASRNVGGQTALTATRSSDHLDAKHSKYDTGNKTSRQTRLSKLKKSETSNSVVLPYEDQMCNTSFKVKGGLARYTKTHDTKRSFQCEVCGHEFGRSDNLKRHARVHTGECHFRCDICEYACSRADYLIAHKRTHTSERPFKCDVCKKTFAQKQRLAEHKRTHTGERPFQCNLCLKNFGRADVLKDHIKTHSNDLPFKCKECGKGFLRKSCLNNHTFRHSSTHPFKCDVCDGGFYHKSSLKRHVCTNSKKHPRKANKKSSKISSKRFTNDRNPGQLAPGHNNKESFKSSHCDASFTSTTTSNQHIKPETHTTNSETGLTNPDDVSTTNQLPSMSDQPLTSDICVNKLQNPEEYEQYRENEEPVVLLDEYIDTCLITSEPGFLEHYDDLFLDQEMPEAIFPDEQDADAGYVTSQLHPVVDWVLTSGIYVNKSQDQEKHKEIIKGFDHEYL